MNERVADGVAFDPLDFIDHAQYISWSLKMVTIPVLCYSILAQLLIEWEARGLTSGPVFTHVINTYCTNQLFLQIAPIDLNLIFENQVGKTWFFNNYEVDFAGYKPLIPLLICTWFLKNQVVKINFNDKIDKQWFHALFWRWDQK